MFLRYILLFSLLAWSISGLSSQDAGPPAFNAARIPNDQQLVLPQDNHVAMDIETRKKGVAAISKRPKIETKIYIDDALRALDVMQSHFYELWIGTWPSAIDWTAAVINTHVSALLGTVSRADPAETQHDTRFSEVVHRYFSHNIAYYFGENAFQIRNEAYDDMLWVVLGWLETIRFINDRNETDSSWHGTQFVPAFAHRARIFYDISSRGWDTSLCAGGMIWNPRLAPYKNAITNQLFISASVSMYLYFPGDSNYSPFYFDTSTNEDTFPGQPHDPRYLNSAIEAYSWLKHSNMTNQFGLFVDGFHIKGWSRNDNIGSGKCDERNEIVYTYNQGVVLSGLRGLWEGTGNSTYLEDGYSLVRNTMAATGWVWSGVIGSTIKKTDTDWDGLGHNGILEELCDRGGDCSQDAQTFKGIYFQHLAQFCEVLPLDAAVPTKTYGASKALAEQHRLNCLVFESWVTHNADAALSTLDQEGRFGMWWGQGSSVKDDSNNVPDGAFDYRNNASILASALWSSQLDPAGHTLDHRSRLRLNPMRSPCDNQRVGQPLTPASDKAEHKDVNDRGRGRTVETQAGGLAVLRTSWELQNLRHRRSS